MCGIWGALSRPDAAFDQSGSEYLRNRGPDGVAQEVIASGQWRLSLVHTRLAIIDLHARSNQPMTSSNGRNVIAYNGELYNYRELRDDLVAAGTSFRTAGDTEVLLEMWTRSGLDALRHCNGMFAFAIFDKQAGELTLVRDRFGVKPLVWGRLPDGGLIFSSSVAAVAEGPRQRARPGVLRARLLLRGLRPRRSMTPFKGVYAVQAGGYLRVRLDPGGLQIEEGRWYRPGKAVRSVSNACPACPMPA